MWAHVMILSTLLYTNKMLYDVGTMLLENQATLLPVISASFHKYARELVDEWGAEESPEVNSRWILSEIKAKYKHHVACVCKVRKYGTLVFRPTSDIHTLLSEALWKLKPFQESRDKANSDIAPKTDGDNEIATCSIAHINSLLHTQIQSYIGKADTNTQDCSLGSHKMKGSAYSTLAVPTTAPPIPLTLHSIFLVHLAELCKQ